MVRRLDLGRPLHYVFGLFSLFASGCMLGPYDDQTVASTRDAIEVSGYHVRASSSVFVEALNFETGRFETIGSSRSASTTNVRPDGQELFGWATPAASGNAVAVPALNFC